MWSEGRVWCDSDKPTMLTIHSITTQLQSQTLAESNSAKTDSTATSSLINSSQDENAAKIRHHSEPHPPGTLLTNTETAKKVKVITFQDGVHKDLALTSFYISQPDTSDNSSSSSWDCANSNPPNKRQCRSMSIPNDGELHTRWLQNQARARVHRPLAVRPNSGGSRNKRNSQGRLPPVWSSLAPSDASTPPESPRSRPSSASSGYFDSPLTSLSNLNKHRCESLQTLPSMSDQSHARHHSGGASIINPSGVAIKTSVASAKSMPSVAAVDSSSHLSPHKQRLLRCQSQPCVIHERRYGVKRRISDDHRPSINFNKMKETAFGKCVASDSNANNSLINRLTSPLNIRPVARYGPILQTIASSPQDINYISTLTSSNSSSNPASTSTSPPTLTNSAKEPTKFSLPVVDSLMDRGEDSDSGCSTTDEELCDITNKMTEPRGVSDSLSVSTAVCNHKMSPSSASSGCACQFDEDSGHNFMFPMEPTHDSEIDLDEIENN